MKEGLIIAVQNRPALWDKCHKHHHNRNILDKEWKAVATELNSTDKYVKLVWKNLRDEFRKQFNKTLRSGDTASDATSSWKYFDSMLFLRDQFLPRKPTENLSLLTNDSDAQVTEDLVEEQVESPSETNEQFDVDPDLTQLEMPATPPIPSVSKTPASVSTLNATSRTGFKRRLTMPEKVSQELVNLRKEKLKLKMNKMEEINKNDEDVGFFNSLLPHVKKLDPRKKMIFRMEVQQLLFNMAYPPEDETFHHQSAPAMNHWRSSHTTDNSTVTHTSTRSPTPLTSPDNDEPLNWCSVNYNELE